MTEKRLTINDLKKQLGSEYSIRTIDYERCLYRDFGNGFNVEISGVDSRKRHRKLSLYLWLGDTLMNCMIAETIHDVECTSDAISAAVENLYEVSKHLIEIGCTDLNTLFKLKSN